MGTSQTKTHFLVDDGNDKTIPSLTSSKVTFQSPVYSLGGLDPTEQHTLKINLLDSGPFTLDYVLIGSDTIPTLTPTSTSTSNFPFFTETIQLSTSVNSPTPSTSTSSLTTGSVPSIVTILTTETITQSSASSTSSSTQFTTAATASGPGASMVGGLSTSKNGLNTAVVGSVVGTVVCLAIIIVGAILYIRRKKTKLSRRTVSNTDNRRTLSGGLGWGWGKGLGKEYGGGGNGGNGGGPSSSETKLETTLATTATTKPSKYLGRPSLQLSIPSFPGARRTSSSILPMHRDRDQNYNSNVNNNVGNGGNFSASTSTSVQKLTVPAPVFLGEDLSANTAATSATTGSAGGAAATTLYSLGEVGGATGLGGGLGTPIDGAGDTDSSPIFDIKQRPVSGSTMTTRVTVGTTINNRASVPESVYHSYYGYPYSYSYSNPNANSYSYLNTPETPISAIGPPPPVPPVPPIPTLPNIPIAFAYSSAGTTETTNKMTKNSRPSPTETNTNSESADTSFGQTSASGGHNGLGSMTSLEEDGNEPFSTSLFPIGKVDYAGSGMGSRLSSAVTGTGSTPRPLPSTPTRTDVKRSEEGYFNTEAKTQNYDYYASQTVQHALQPHDLSSGSGSGKGEGQNHHRFLPTTPTTAATTTGESVVHIHEDGGVRLDFSNSAPVTRRRELPPPYRDYGI